MVPATRTKSKSWPPDLNWAENMILKPIFFHRALNHKNLIKLLGVVIPRSSSNDPIYVVLEFMTKGALLEYLRSRGRTIVKPINLLDFAR